jgi:hypothetical protein
VGGSNSWGSVGGQVRSEKVINRLSCGREFPGRLMLTVVYTQEEEEDEGGAVFP